MVRCKWMKFLMAAVVLAVLVGRGVPAMAEQVCVTNDITIPLSSVADSMTPPAESGYLNLLEVEAGSEVGIGLRLRVRYPFGPGITNPTAQLWAYNLNSMVGQNIGGVNGNIRVRRVYVPATGFAYYECTGTGISFQSTPAYSGSAEGNPFFKMVLYSKPDINMYAGSVPVLLSVGEPTATVLAAPPTVPPVRANVKTKWSYLRTPATPPATGDLKWTINYNSSQYSSGSSLYLLKGGTVEGGVGFDLFSNEYLDIKPYSYDRGLASLTSFPDELGQHHVYYVNSSNQLVRRLYDTYVETYVESTPVPETGVPSSPNAVYNIGQPTYLFYIRDGDELVRAISVDGEEAFTVASTGITGYAVADVVELPLDMVVFAMLHSGVDGDPWMCAVGTWVPETEDYTSWTTPVSTGLVGKAARGSLSRHHDGLLVFSYVDDAGALQTRRCENPRYDGSGNWV